MKKKSCLVCIIMLLVILTGCANYNWEMYNSKMVVSTSTGENTTIDNTVLINKESGEAWILKVKKEGYYFERLERKSADGTTDR